MNFKTYFLKLSQSERKIFYSKIIHVLNLFNIDYKILARIELIPEKSKRRLSAFLKYLKINKFNNKFFIYNYKSIFPRLWIGDIK